MAEEPVPLSEQEAQPPAPETATVAGTAEDRKAAAALENLSSRVDEDASNSTAGSKDTAALGAAVSNLSIKEGVEVSKKKVKVDPADVSFLVQELEISKAKATELLKSHEGKRALALREFVLLPARN